MTGGGSLGIRTSSYGSLDKQQHQLLQNGAAVLLSTTGSGTRSKIKEKDRLVHWIFKFAGRRKFGMLLICLISAAVFFWVLYIGKGTQDNEHVNFNLNTTINRLGFSATPQEQRRVFRNDDRSLEIFDNRIIMPPPPPSYFLGYTLPPGHPCNSFTLPPPPADKKRTGPRRMYFLSVYLLLYVRHLLVF